MTPDCIENSVWPPGMKQEEIAANYELNEILMHIN